MFKYSSNITFVYYNDLEYGSQFFEEVLGLTEIMDQGFAKVYQVNKTAFVGIVQLKEETNYKGNTLVSFNTDNVKNEYERVRKLEVFDLTDIQRIEQIPLDSFFFKDREGHDFEIQEFLSEDNKRVF